MSLYFYWNPLVWPWYVDQAPVQPCLAGLGDIRGNGSVCQRAVAPGQLGLVSLGAGFSMRFMSIIKIDMSGVVDGMNTRGGRPSSSITYFIAYFAAPHHPARK
jgi:hypothetical protein